MRRRTALVAAACSLLLAGCGGSGSDADDADRAAPRDRATTTATTAADEDLPPVQVTAPVAFTNVKDRVVVEGTASVSEGDLRWAVLDAAGEPFVSGRADASCGAPCRGDFRFTVPLGTVEIGSWELHVWAPNAAEGAEASSTERLHDTFVPITVVKQLDPDAPAADALPPGGVPSSPTG